MNSFQYLNKQDFNTKTSLEEILLNYKNLPDNIQRSIDSCNIDESNVKIRCEKMFSDGCEQISKYVYAPKCPKNFYSYGLSLCVPLCPLNFK